MRFFGFVPDHTLAALYRLASVFVFPSLYEGFGLPVLEAMQRGLPVACSDRSSLPEVAGGAALLFDPEKTDQISAAMEQLLAGGSEIEGLRDKGRERARQFTWDATARATAASYERVLAA